MKVRDDSYFPSGEKVETLPQHFISPEVCDIFDALKAYAIAGQTKRSDDQVEAAVAVSEGLSDYEALLEGQEDVMEVVSQVATDSIVIDWGVRMIAEGNTDFSIDDPAPLQSTERRSPFKKWSRNSNSLEEAIASREEELLGRLETMTALTREEIITGDHTIESDAIVRAIVHTTTSPFERLRLFSGKMMGMELPIPADDESDRKEMSEPLSQAA